MKSAREIAHFLDEYCTLLELNGADAFRTRAYANAVRIFENFTENIEDIVAQNALTECNAVSIIGDCLKVNFPYTSTLPYMSV